MDSHDFKSRVRTVLLRDWDPIGVADEPAAQDEYDVYAKEVARLIRSGVSAAGVANYLAAAEGERMGLPVDPSRADRVARQLVALRRP